MNIKDAKIVFFGFGDVGYKCLQYMLENDYYVIAVFTHDYDKHENNWFNTPENIAKEYGIDVFKPSNLNSTKWTRKFKYLNPDLILSLYYRNKIPPEIYTQAKLGAYNLHGSYLPSYKGRAPLNWAILNGESYTGASLHVLEDTYDTGDIIARTKINISPNEYVADVIPKVSKTTLKLFCDNLDNLILGNVNRQKQSLINDVQPSYFGKRTPEDSRIDFTKTSQQIRNLIRAVSKPFNGAFFENDKCRYVIWQADIEKTRTNYPAGTIISRTPQVLSISTIDGILHATRYEILPK